MLLALKELCAHTVRVEDFELIVGKSRKAPDPEWASEWIVADTKGEWTIREDGLYHNPDHE
jgi:formate C-acetyltransferase